MASRNESTSRLDRIVMLWNLTGAEAGQLFNVSRRTFDKWLEAGPPTEFAPAIAALSDATELMERYLPGDRIPVVVRRASALTKNRSLTELASAGKYDEVLAAVRQMFELRRVQS